MEKERKKKCKIKRKPGHFIKDTPKYNKKTHCFFCLKRKKLQKIKETTMCKECMNTFLKNIKRTPYWGSI